MPTRSKPLTEELLPSRRKLRAALGRGRWTLRDFAVTYALSERQARRHLAALQRFDRIVRTGETEPVTDADGNPARGRPRHVYRVNIAQ